tara:strand:+ start:433 stop:744 length:312 start_codon:yes stop_codon:yes gene_type:complete
MELDSDLLYTRVISPKARKRFNISNSTICYSNTIYFTVLVMQFLIIYIIFSIYSSDLNILIKDARTNMGDLAEVLPEIRNTLNIVKQLCNVPEYKSYCHPDPQ